MLGLSNVEYCVGGGAEATCREWAGSVLLLLLAERSAQVGVQHLLYQP